MCTRGCFSFLTLTSCCVLVAATTPTLAMAAPQQRAQASEDAGGWAFTGQVGSGMSFYFGEQASDPAFSFAVGRFLSDTLQVEGQLLGVAGRPREHSGESYNRDNLVSTSWSRVQRRMLLALTRVNLYLGEGRLRPYLFFGAGLGWGHEETQRTTRSITATGGVDTATHAYENQGIGFATLLGSGFDIGLTDRWRARPEVLMPLLWGAPQPGYVTLTVGITYTTRPPRSSGGAYAIRSRALAGESSAAAWRRVVAIAPGNVVRLQVHRDTWGLRDGNVEKPGLRTLLGWFVSADDDALVVRVMPGARTDTWRIPRIFVDRIERGRLERNGPWEGVLGGFVVGAGIGALGYLGSGGRDDHEIWIPAGTIFFGAPLALAGGLGDHAHRTFEATELIYEARRVATGRRPKSLRVRDSP